MSNSTSLNSINKYVSKFSSISGMKTRFWGPNAWNFLFCSVLGTYPDRLDKKNKTHIKIKNEFINLFNSLGFIMPCIYCRQSYRQFIKELPLNKYMNTRIELCFWLYKLKDKVNKKLLKQENECFKKEHEKIIARFKEKKINKIQYKCLYDKLKKDICITKKSPPFIEVLNKYESYRAGCKNSNKMCK